jgi:phosphatidylglycerophosphate synthase
MLSAKLGHFLDIPLAPLVRRIPFSPNVLTVTGFLITCIAALVIPYSLRLGGILILVGGAFDMIDGIAARTGGTATRFGAFLDSVLDRYSDAFLFLALAWYFSSEGDYTGALLSIATLIGAFLISYARARAEGLGEPCQVGIMERPERIILLIFAALTGWLVPVLWVMAVLTHVTVIQRIYHVRKTMKEKA